MSYLRNSKGANKPFCSPFKSKLNVNISSNSPNSIKQPVSPCGSSPYKKILKRTQVLDSKNRARDCNEDCKCDTETIQNRITSKKKEISILEESVSQKKEKIESLKKLINLWRNGCQEALQECLLTLQKKNDETISMSKLLQSLGIPEDLINYSEEDGSFN